MFFGSIDTSVDGLLSDFEEPGKINLMDFMERHYMFNMTLDKFGYLTGRSLATFRRDFKKAYNTTRKSGSWKKATSARALPDCRTTP